MRLAIFEPDIPQNTGSMLRLAACLGVAVDIIEPLGFVMDNKHLRRAGMDYLDLTKIVRHESWNIFLQKRRDDKGRLVLLTTKAPISYTDFQFHMSDSLLTGRESAGVPDNVHKACDAAVCVPMVPNARSLNVAQTAAMVLGEALRQTNSFPQSF